MWKFIKIIVVIFSVCFVYILGAHGYKSKWFPFGAGHFTYLKSLVATEKQYDDSYQAKRCFNYVTHFQFYQEAAKKGVRIDKLFVGDSLVSGFILHNLHDVSYKRMALSGNIIECMPLLTESITSLKPSKVLLYIGGNDTDGQGRQTMEEAAKTYASSVDTLIKSGIKVIIHGIHFGSGHRGRVFDKVEKLNANLESIAKKRNLLYIPPVPAFNFWETGVDTRYSNDGEHLIFSGYEKWISHIRVHLPDF